MAEIKVGDAFGIDAAALAAIDFDLALDRIVNDIKTDFIHAPHLSLIYRRAREQLIAAVKADLKGGNFLPGIPLQIEVPKTFRMPVESAKRLGPNYSRPGSILLPKDRLLYQAIADQAASIIDANLDDERSFSHKLADTDSKAMFVPTRTCWKSLQDKLSEHAADKSAKYVMRLDIANYFSAINQHTLVNTLKDCGFPGAFASRLEAMLLRYTGVRSSRGILQGIYPSDLLGNFYMAPIDRFLKEQGVSSARYVDDIYIFVESVVEAEQLLRTLIPELRSYDLALNENKSRIMPKSLLYTMEPDLERLFQEAVDEISSQIDDDDFDADYGFQTEWDEEDDQSDEDEDEDDHAEDDGEVPQHDDLELAATKSLFDSLDDYPGQEENVERFCLPLFGKAESDYAVDHVMVAFSKRPSMTQIYGSYLAKFIEQERVREFLAGEAEDTDLLDWQRMWALAALMQADDPTADEVKIAFDISRDGTLHEALRAVGAYYAALHGDHGRRNSLRTAYAQMPPYVQSAVYAASRFWPGAERSNAKAMWAADSSLHVLMTEAMKKKPG